MDPELRRLAVVVIITLVVAVRLVAHSQAGGMLRDQSDGLEREGGVVVGIALRLVFLVGGLGGLGVWIADPDALPGTIELPAAAQWAGLAVAEAGLILLIAVHLALGVHFSGTLHSPDDHRLVTSGPYARIRHPMYTSFLLLFAGFGLLTGNVPLMAVMFGSQAWVLGVRLRHEEAQLAERFADDWARYRSSTGALVPRFGTR
ncbi:MAG: isoprenylcysteine carboxylmethyltransferase family protein [Actinomycetota bacterium]